jgi:hypothetical protein
MRGERRKGENGGQERIGEETERKFPFSILHLFSSSLL